MIIGALGLELQTQSHSAPTVEQRLTAIHHLFDWLATDQIVRHNPAASVRNPSHTAKEGKTPSPTPLKRDSWSTESMSRR